MGCYRSHSHKNITQKRQLIQSKNKVICNKDIKKPSKSPTSNISRLNVSTLLKSVRKKNIVNTTVNTQTK